MKFLLDQSADARLVPYLQQLGHDVTRIARDHPHSLPDHEVLAIAYREGRILITDDRDFGELIFKKQQPHAGVIYFRLSTTHFALLRERLSHVLSHYADQLDQFIVVTDRRVRVRAQP